MKVAKEYILKAVKELKNLECICNKEETCERCIAIMKLNSIHNFLSK